MNRTGLAEALAKESGLSKTTAEWIVESFFGHMAEALAGGDRVEIRGLFSIYVKNYGPYTGRNPKTGEPIEVPAKKLPFFKCGKELKERVDRQ
jgi:integration host factor subunit beta